MRLSTSTDSIQVRSQSAVLPLLLFITSLVSAATAIPMNLGHSSEAVKYPFLSLKETSPEKVQGNTHPIWTGLFPGADISKSIHPGQQQATAHIVAGSEMDNTHGFSLFHSTPQRYLEGIDLRERLAKKAAFNLPLLSMPQTAVQHELSKDPPSLNRLESPTRETEDTVKLLKRPELYVAPIKKHQHQQQHRKVSPSFFKSAEIEAKKEDWRPKVSNRPFKVPTTNLNIVESSFSVLSNESDDARTSPPRQLKSEFFKGESEESAGKETLTHEEMSGSSQKHTGQKYQEIEERKVDGDNNTSRYGSKKIQRRRDNKTLHQEKNFHQGSVNDTKTMQDKGKQMMLNESTKRLQEILKNEKKKEAKAEQRHLSKEADLFRRESLKAAIQYKTLDRSGYDRQFKHNERVQARQQKDMKEDKMKEDAIEAVNESRRLKGKSATISIKPNSSSDDSSKSITTNKTIEQLFNLQLQRLQNDKEAITKLWNETLKLKKQSEKKKSSKKVTDEITRSSGIRFKSPKESGVSSNAS